MAYAPGLLFFGLKGEEEMTQLEAARQGIVTKEMQQVAEKERVAVEVIQQGLVEGTIVIPFNSQKTDKDPQGIGKGLSTKVSASIGTGKNSSAMENELEKLKVALSAGAHTIMDLSLGGNLDLIRRRILANCPVPIGTLPVYQAFAESFTDKGVLGIDIESMFQIIEKQAKDGVDFMGFHSAMTLETLDRMTKQGRVNDLVSWGGALLAGWMIYHERENPLYTYYDRILEIAEKYDITLSLADGLRPGCLADSLDRAQMQELIILGELVDRARAAGVQIMIKGPGHVHPNQINATIIMEKQLCQGAPYFVFGPLATDVVPGHDHITSAIGGALAAGAGADFLCYVTPAEHVRFPTIEDVREGVIAARIAAHVGDLMKGIEGAKEWDLEMSKARLPWNTTKQKEVALDPDALPEEGEQIVTKCNLCSGKCAIRTLANHLGRDAWIC